MKYDYILFDLDGTITDSKTGIINSVLYSLSKFNIKVQDITSLESFLGPPLSYSYENFYNFSKEDATLAIEYYREYFSTKGKFENTPYSGIKEVLAKLKAKNKKLIIATSKPTFFTKQILEHFKLTDYFDFIVGSNLDGTLSLKEEVISYAIEKFNIAREAAIMIGDRVFDIEGAKKNNIASIGVLYGYGSFDEINKAHPDYIVNTVDELLDILL